MIKNPDPYLIQSEDPGVALVMSDASFSWNSSACNSPESPVTVANGVKKKGKAEPSVELAQNGAHTQDTKPTLRNITFTLPKVCVCARKNYFEQRCLKEKQNATQWDMCSMCFFQENNQQSGSNV